jgi:hypothetical protein
MGNCTSFNPTVSKRNARQPASMLSVMNANVHAWEQIMARAMMAVGLRYQTHSQLDGETSILLAG